MADVLRDEQVMFFDYLLNESDRALNLIIDDEKVGAKQRMDIYHNAYRLSLKGVIGDNYERFKHYVGDAQFDQIAAAYIGEYPSKQRNIRYYGEHLPAFLAKAFPDDTYVAELADLDWKLRAAFDGPEAAILDGTRITELGERWIDAKLRLHPTSSFVTANHNIVALWTAIENDQEVPKAEKLGAQIPILVWRKELQPHFRSRTSAEAAALQYIETGHSFSKLSEFLMESMGEEDALQNLSQWLSTWIADGLLVEA